MNSNGPHQSGHMRRDSSHGETAPTGLGLGRGMPQGSQTPRSGNRPMPGNYNPYPPHQGPNHYNQGSFIPNQPYRNPSNQGRGGMGGPSYHNPGHMGGYPNNNRGGAGAGGRSPALSHSLPSTPQTTAAQIAGNAPMQSPQFSYTQHLTPNVSPHFRVNI